MADLQKIHDSILKGDVKTAVDTTKQALEEGADPKELVDTYMIPAMDEVGRKFECNELFVPELLLTARVMKNCLELVRPLLKETGAKPVGKVVAGTVKGDLHDIGKNLVVSMLEGGGFEVTDLGVDVAPEQFVAAAKEQEADLIALSALLTTTMPAMKSVIEALKSDGARDKVKIIIGGAPVTQQYADEIGADGYSDNANGAVNMARKLVAS